MSPRCALGRIQIDEVDVEQAKEDGWRKHGILVVRPDDPRLGWIEQKIIRDIGRKLYGQSEAGRG
jgi:hypothetical protein